MTPASIKILFSFVAVMDAVASIVNFALGFKLGRLGNKAAMYGWYAAGTWTVVVLIFICLKISEL